MLDTIEGVEDVFCKAAHLRIVRATEPTTAAGNLTSFLLAIVFNSTEPNPSITRSMKSCSSLSCELTRLGKHQASIVGLTKKQ